MTPKTLVVLTAAASVGLGASVAFAQKAPAPKLSTSKADIKKGQELFAAKGCVGCHKVGGGKLVGPDLKGVLTRRDPAWVTRMILQPEVMVREDPEAKKMLGQYFLPMPNQGVDAAKELPFILAYLNSAK